MTCFGGLGIWVSHTWQHVGAIFGRVWGPFAIFDSKSLYSAGKNYLNK